jgi:ABC-type Fe3+-citrate transport system substrate-binding protein
VNETTNFFKKNSPKLNQVFDNLKTKTRVLAFVYDTEDYKDELKNLKTAARASGRREELRFGLITDHKIIKHYKALYSN